MLPTYTRNRYMMRLPAFPMILVALFVALPASLAHAHPGHPHAGEGLHSGFLHPLLGIDHLMAMLAVGLLSAQLGGRAIFAIPSAFLAGMVLGGVCGAGTWHLGPVELGIAASMVTLGAAVAWNRQLPLAVPLALAAVFGCFHGHAHGAEMPALSSPVAYGIGFLMATAALHVTGILVGRYALASVRGTAGLRLSGAAIAAAGVCFALIV
jgi:urease accessory protein